MTASLNEALQVAHSQKEAFFDRLCALLAIPSISTDPAHNADMQAAAQWLATELADMGFSNATVFSTEKHPVVFAEWLGAGSTAPTVLIYGHYDVQPVEPLELWHTKPFEATLRGENLYARGASDMKGQILATLSAIRSILATGPLPVNVKYILEGEEEIGSPSLAKFLNDHKELLASSLALNPDAGMIAADVPTIVYGLRGMAYFELRVFGPAHDLHSGLYGGVVRNPAIVLADLISGMHDSEGRVTLPGFYDCVQPISQAEHQALASLPMDEDFYLKNTGATGLWGEAGYLPVERVGARPTLDVNGILAGFTGEGSKTVIPAWAMAKISMRLVPDQDPEQVHRQLLTYLSQKTPASIRWELTEMSGGPASVTDIHGPGTQALSKSMQAVWGKAPVFKREGGSIPVVADMQKILGIDSVLTGFGLPDDNLHAPNEKLHLPTWYRGIDALIHFVFNLAEMK